MTTHVSKGTLIIKRRSVNIMQLLEDDGSEDDVFTVVLEDDVLRWFGGRRVYGGLEDDVYMVVWRTTCIWWFGG